MYVVVRLLSSCPVGGAEPAGVRDAWAVGGGHEPISAAQRAAELGQANREQGAASAERARVVEEFRERQRQAMLNKVSNSRQMLK